MIKWKKLPRALVLVWKTMEESCMESACGSGEIAFSLLLFLIDVAVFPLL